MRYIVILEYPFLAYQLPDLTAHRDQTVYLVKHESPLCGGLSSRATVITADPGQHETYRALEINPADRIILCTVTPDATERILHALLSVCNTVPVVVVGSHGRAACRLKQHNLSFLFLQELSGKTIEKEWQYIRNREQTEEVRRLTQRAESVLILTQHDPDPDALASGLALRTLLGRNRATAPLASFSRVTRSENISMSRLLDIRCNTIEEGSLANYAMIAMVDVQPPYFGNGIPGADIIFDHHPQVADYACSFKDIRVEYGATSTILSEYLIASGGTFNQRLATALLYGIKADTLMLGREVHAADVEVFTHLYPLANHNIIRRIENPSLNPEEVNSFIRALKKYRLVNRVVFAHLGKVGREDIIPRLADFCLQIDGAEWSVVSGLFGGRVIISVRNGGYGRSAGEVVKKIFPDPETAGGHRSMAKVNIAWSDFKKLLRVRSLAALEETIVDSFLEEAGEGRG